MQKISLEVGWPLIEKAFARLVHIVEGRARDDFTNEDYMLLYSTVYGMCIMRGGDEFVYAGYKSLLENYLTYQVLPSLMQKHDLHLLDELVKRWSSYLLLVRRLGFFHYLDYYYTSKCALPSLKDTALGCFCRLVYAPVEARAKDAFLTSIWLPILLQRCCVIYRGISQGSGADRSLLKKALGFFVSIKPSDTEFFKKLEPLAKDDEELREFLETAMKNAVNGQEPHTVIE